VIQVHGKQFYSGDKRVLAVFGRPHPILNHLITSENREHSSPDDEMIPPKWVTTAANMANLILRLEHLQTPCGSVLIVTDDEGALRALDWEDHVSRMRRLLDLHYGKDGVRLQPRSSTSGIRDALHAYLAGDLRATEEIRVQTGGTAFQRQVWAALRAIPPGSTVTYGHLAAHLQRPDAARAVGMANGANPIPIVVPCHRVTGADGSLTGFGSGIERKRWLLEHEGVRVAAQEHRPLTGA
jgi:methylated-DNA-[protein]-cysteine S-methyltransferase